MTWTNITLPNFESPVALHHASGEVTVLDRQAWYWALTLGRFGGWSPDGTKLARGNSRYRFGYQPLMRDREYRIERDDAVALAKGIRKALDKGAKLSGEARETATVALELSRHQPSRMQVERQAAAMQGGFRADEELVNPSESAPWLLPAGIAFSGQTLVSAFPPFLHRNYPDAFVAEYRRLADRLEAGGPTRISAETPAGWYDPSTPTKRVRVTSSRRASIAGVPVTVGQLLTVPVPQVAQLASAGLAVEVDDNGHAVEQRCECDHCRVARQHGATHGVAA